MNDQDETIPATPDDYRGSALRELNRVGTAATMMVIAGTMIVLVITMMLGHYNSLAHCGPKAVLDGLALTLLIGNQGRWRSLALLGVVYGLVLVLQVGVVYLLLVMVLAGSAAAGVGRLASTLNRTLALGLAVVTFEILAGCGAPIKILLATRHGDEPVLWMMWFAEWPLRTAGALTGFWLARRWLKRASRADGTRDALVPAASHPVIAGATSSATNGSGTAARAKSMMRRVHGLRPAALRLSAAVVACMVPILLESWLALGLAAGAFLVYGWWAGLGRRVLGVLIGLAWGWLIFAFASFLWHRDQARAVDLVRSFMLGMLPIAVAAPTLILTTRPVDLIRVLRRCRIPAVALIPVAHIARQVPVARARLAADMATLRDRGLWRGPGSVLRNPVAIGRGLLGPQLHTWMTALADESSPTGHHRANPFTGQVAGPRADPSEPVVESTTSGA